MNRRPLILALLHTLLSVMLFVLVWRHESMTPALLGAAFLLDPDKRELIGLFAAISMMLLLLVVEWSTIINYLFIDRMDLHKVERTFRHLPTRAEIFVTNILSVLLLLLFVQFIAKVYAMTFTLSTTTTEANRTHRMVMADVDGDGDIDYLAHNVAAGGVHDLYLNDGNGTFTRVTYGNAVSPTGTAGGDIDNDGDMDFIDVDANGTTVSKMVNNGSASFTSYGIASLGFVGRQPLMGDFDGNGSIDFMLLGAAASNALFLNDGHGNFTQTTSPRPDATNGGAVADFNSDGALDLVFIDASSDPKVYLNSGTGAFVQSFTAAVDLLSPIAAGDFDGDGDIDFSAIDATSQFFIYKNNGQGTSFAAGTVTNINIDAARTTAAGDIDNDGDMDVIIGGADGVVDGARLHLNDGTAVFTENGTPTEATDKVMAVAIGDIDGDGDLDYIRGNGNASGEVNRHYKSDQAATSANTAPTAPGSLTGAVVGRTPTNGNTFVDDSGIGSNIWGFPQEAGLSDDVRSTTNSMSTGEISHYLKATNFRYIIPATATILGIQVDVERKHSGGLTMRDNAIRIVKGGTIGSTDRSSGSDWPASDAYVTYGGPTDLWGETWTAGDINASGFGFALSVQDVLGFGGGSVDHIRITVYYDRATVRLSWGSGSDTQTSARMLQYQVRVGTGAAAHNVVSGRTASPNWVGRVVPNGQSRTYLVKDLLCRTGLTYHWTVGTVDSGFKRTDATEQAFFLDSNCALSFPGGGSPGLSPNAPGGGLPASFWRQGKSDSGASPNLGSVTVHGFNDLDGNGIRSARERLSFPGLPVTASGRTADGVAVRQTLTLFEPGKIAFQLLPSDDRGYWFFADTGSLVLTGYRPTMPTLTGGIVLRSDTDASVSFGFRPASLIGYAPCLEIRDPLPDERADSDALILLQRLEDAYGHRATEGITFGGTLISRRDFFMLLQRTHCLPLVRTADELAVKLRETRDALGAHGPITLRDLPLNMNSADAVLVYSLAASGLPVARDTVAGPAADMTSPISRREAILLTEAAMRIPESRRSLSEGTLPSDLAATDDLVPHFRLLQSLGVLPESFYPILGTDQGIDTFEATLLVARSALRAGRIGMLPVSFESGIRTKKSAPVPTFLSEIPKFRIPDCLRRDARRADRVSFTDLLPGDPLEPGLREILSRSIRNGDDKTLWLHSAVRRPTEFGVTQGQIALVPDEPVSVLETVRDLLILRCLPQPTAKEALQNKGRLSEGSGESRVPRDRISDLARDTSFASRVLYRAQDREKEFDLSLFTYAPNLLLKETRSPGSSFTVEEGSELMSSALMNLLVRQEILTPQEAELKAASLSFALQGTFLGMADLDWRMSGIAKNRPLTRRMLLEFLATVLTGKAPAKAVGETTNLPLGEIWWERLR